jgi:hypothetical protein
MARFLLYKLFKKNPLIFFWGFLAFILLSIFLGCLWFYDNFLIVKDEFLNFLPSDTILYWSTYKTENNLLLEISKTLFTKETQEQIDYLSHEISPYSQKIALALLPPTSSSPQLTFKQFENFVFFSRVDSKNLENIKKELEKLNFNYITDINGKIIITNHKDELLKILKVHNGKIPSLINYKLNLIALNIANQLPTKIYFSDFKFQNFSDLKFSSNIFSPNKLIIKKEPAENKIYYTLILNNADLITLERLIPKILATLFPEMQEKTLPDGTKVQELIANPLNFKIQKNNLKGVEIDSIDIPQLNAKILITEINSRIIISNSEKMMGDYLKEKNPILVKILENFSKAKVLNIFGFVGNIEFE